MNETKEMTANFTYFVGDLCYVLTERMVMTMSFFSMLIS
jgi:hypothetical protein